MRTMIVTGLLLLVSWSAQAQAASAPQAPSGEAEGNLFHEPFLQLSHKIPGCKAPRGPWWTAAEAQADIHWRANSGVSCYLAGKCRLMNSYEYDSGIAGRVKETFERDFRFEASSVWAHVQRRFVTLMGCVKDESQKSALIAAMQGIDDVNQVIDQLSVGVSDMPKYRVASGPAPAGWQVTPWAPTGIASPLFESHPAFDPLTGDFYFVRSSREFRGWRLLTSRCTPEGWSAPEPPPFAGDGVEADPWFTPDGRQLYFISTRSTDGITDRKLDIWRVERDAQGRWATPQRLPEPVNSADNEWFPRLAPDGWLYFGSGRPGGIGKTDIWRARQDEKGRWHVENLGPEINGPGSQYEAEISRDGQRMIVMTDEGLYLSRRAGDRWLPREKLGPEVNVNATEVGALWSPSGRAFLFARDTRGEASGEFFLARETGSGEEAWPPSCGGKGAKP